MQGKTVKKVPFAIDRKSTEGLSEQMTNSLRRAIVSGYYKSGDVLPTILQWSKILNVSIRVPEAAIATLVKEGLVTARKRFGCVVVSPVSARVFLPTGASGDIVRGFVTDGFHAGAAKTFLPESDGSLILSMLPNSFVYLEVGAR